MSFDRPTALRAVRRLASCGVLLWCAVSVVEAQSLVFTSVSQTGPHPFVAAGDELRRPATGAYDVVVLRVEFQPDTSRFTTGDGTFEGVLFDGLEPNIEPLPHDAAYVQAHLDFLSHYVDRVSDGRALVRTHLVPEIVRLSSVMAAYSPTGPEADSDDELRKLAFMVEEAWTRASEASSFDMSGFDPSRTALMIMHAGVGRDVELIGTTLDKTPQDLPSLYFDQRTLSRLLGASDLSFNGFPVAQTILLPRTETRKGTDFIADEPFLFELSINGLLAASFFNFLGVPDLFDTATGQSAIGPFGLMDTQGIFAYRGLFPPEPMVWTKYYLGWTEPYELNGGEEQLVSLSAASIHGESESARAVISGAEYFLIENRYRDPEQDGLTMQIWKGGEIVEQHVENGDETFNAFNVDGFVGGVVVGVDNYDWALPGGVDEDENTLNGGILVWHVDERRLRAGLDDNAVNVGVNSRAVDLEEADGAQDIGHPSTGPFGPQAELGSPFDFYYSGNPASVLLAGGREVTLYENRFGPDTYPNSATNAGGPSFIVLSDFSEPGHEMTFVYRQEPDSGVEPLAMPVLDARIPEPDTVTGGGSALFGSGSFVACGSMCTPFVFSASAGAYFLPENGGARSGVTTAPVVGQRVASLETSEEFGQRIVIRSSFAPETDPTVEVIELPNEVRDFRPESPLIRTVENDRDVYHIIESSGGSSYVLSASSEGVSIVSFPVENGAVSLSARTVENEGELIVVTRTGVADIAGNPIRDGGWSFSLSPEDMVGQSVFGNDAGGLIGLLPIVSTGEILVFGSNGKTVVVDVAAEAERFGASMDDSLGAYPILVDLDEDGRLDVLCTFGSTLWAFSQSGAVHRHFPIRTPGVVRAQPLAARFGDSIGIVVAGDDGYIYAYDTSRRQRPISGFPLEVGLSAPATPAFFDESTLVAVSKEGELKGWRLDGVTDVLWSRLYGSGDNDSYVRVEGGDAEPEPADGALIVDEETYNWPNPIRDGSTHLRVETRRDASVGVRIIDAGGRLIDDVVLGPVRSGIPQEMLWQADVSSGLYFARFTARTSDGEEETKLVKMAVMR